MSSAPSASLAQDSGDEQAVRQLSSAWVEAMGATDITRLMGMVTDDVVFLPPGFPAIRGKAAVKAMYASFFPQFSRVEQAVNIEEVLVAGDWAFSWGTEILTLVPKAGGSPLQLRSRGISVIKRGSDGSWRFARGLTQPLTSAQTDPVDVKTAPKN